MDHSININKNDHFCKLPTLSRKLEEHLQAYFDETETSLSKTSIVTVDTMIPNFQFEQVTVIFCDIWL